MANPRNWDGERVGRLTVIKYLYTESYGNTGKSHRMYLCKCDCGNTKIVSTCDLQRGNVKSCGCLLKELYQSGMYHNIKHGQSKTRLGQCYYHMKRRCSHDPNWVKKGISVCEEWANNPQAFFDWALSHGYDDSLTLDRIDANGDYCPENCRWATMRQQANNKTNNHYVTIGGITHTISEWSEISGVAPATISKRIENGKPEEELLVPVGLDYFETNGERKSYKHLVTINGETKTISEWADFCGVSRACICSRLRAGWKGEEIISKRGEVYHGNRIDNINKNRRVVERRYANG